MPKLLLLFGLVFYSDFSMAQTAIRYEDETLEEFVKAYMPDGAKLTHHIIESSWNSNKVILAFYDQFCKINTISGNLIERNIILTKMFLYRSGNQYEIIQIDTLWQEGNGFPVIETVFFANADRDNSLELLMVVSWMVKNYYTYGTMYSTFVYDDLIQVDGQEMILKKEISEQLSGGCDCDYSDYPSKKAKFKTADEIRKELIRLGY